MLESITALIITYNEAPNIERTVGKLGRFGRVVVIDSGSDDGTREMVANCGNATVIIRPFDNFAGQCNFGLAHSSVDTEWVLSLDADYVLSDELLAELDNLKLPIEVAGYRARFQYAVFGRAIRCAVYPPVVVLFRKSCARYVQDGHAHRVVVDGPIENLSAHVYHDDRKPLTRWLESQRSYARREAEHLEQHDRTTLRWQDRIRLLIGAAPPLMFVYVFLLRGGFLDGRHGLYYALQRAYAELLLSLELLDRKLRRIASR